MDGRQTNGNVELDLELVDQLCQHISSRTGNAIRDLRIECFCGTCILFGQASSYYAKQIAQTVVMAVTSSGRLENRITVR